VLFDPFEKEFYLPAAPVQFCNREGWINSIVRKKGKHLSGFWIPVTDPPQLIRIMLRRVIASKPDDLITYKTGLTVGGVELEGCAAIRVK